MPARKVGDIVSWLSVGRGMRTIKRGEVYRVVPPLGHQTDMPSRTIIRDHESYIVAVPMPDGSRKLYWPPVSALRTDPPPKRKPRGGK